MYGKRRIRIKIDHYGIDCYALQNLRKENSLDRTQYICKSIQFIRRSIFVCALGIQMDSCFIFIYFFFLLFFMFSPRNRWTLQITFLYLRLREAKVESSVKIIVSPFWKQWIVCRKCNQVITKDFSLVNITKTRLYILTPLNPTFIY